MSGKVPNEALYLLRPELIESTYHHYRVTKDKSWIGAGIKFLEAEVEKTNSEELRSFSWGSLKI